MSFQQYISTFNKIVVIILALSYLTPVLTNAIETIQPIEQSVSDNFDSEMLEEDLSDKEINLVDKSLFWQSPERKLPFDYFLSQVPQDPELKLNTPPPQA